MQVSSFYVYAIGFVAQGFFSARMLIQWILSERARRVVSPNAYWLCSLVGSAIIVSYGAFRLDPVLIVGQSVGFFTYSRNIVIYKKNKGKQ